MKSAYKSAEQVNNLREIQAIKRLSPHQNIVKLEEVLFDPPTGRLALVFELLEDRQEHFSNEQVKSFMRQTLTALDHMHSKGVFHRDVKPENILVDTSGKRLKLADFGSCRGINSKPPFTEYISTRWYRPPECLLTCGMYGAGMDIWGAGCILFELTTLYPLFPGADELDQINRIHRVLGTPSPSVLANLKKYASAQANFSFKQQHGIGLSKLLPDAKSHCLDLLTRSVEYDASKRIDSKGAINHPYFVGDVPIKPRISKAATKDSKVKQKPDSSTTSSSLASSNPDTTDKTSSGQSTSEETPVTKTRSMVSILLARSDKKDFVKEAKERNKTIFRQKKQHPPLAKVASDKNIRTTRNNSLPKLKSLLPESKRQRESKPFSKPVQDQKPRIRQPKKYAHIRSSGYGGASSMASSLNRKA
eukprot:scaffold3932_cov87-Cyclotella_meneghiniana.AAC.31